MSIEWMGVHHSEHGDFKNLSIHVVTYETEESCYVTAERKLADEARWSAIQRD